MGTLPLTQRIPNAEPNDRIAQIRFCHRDKTAFSTWEGAEHGAVELKRRFPMLLAASANDQ